MAQSPYPAKAPINYHSELMYKKRVHSKAARHVSKFIKLSSRSRTYMNCWPSIQKIVTNCRGFDELRKLGLEDNFMRYYDDWAQKATWPFRSNHVSFSDDHLKRATSGQDEILWPTPSMVMRIRDALSVQPTTLWPMMLWELSKSLAESHARNEEATHSTALVARTLLSLWNLCLRVGERPNLGLKHPHELLTTSLDLKWPVLPGVQALDASPEILATPLPPLPENPGGNTPFEYASPALLTLYTFQEGNGTSALPESQHLVQLFRHILNQSQTRSVPPTLEAEISACTSPPLKHFYERLTQDLRLGEHRHKPSNPASPNRGSTPVHSAPNRPSVECAAPHHPVVQSVAREQQMSPPPSTLHPSSATADALPEDASPGDGPHASTVAELVGLTTPEMEPSMSSDLDQRSGGLATPRNDVSSGSEAQTGWTPEADASLGDPGTRPGDGPQARTMAEIVGLSKPEMEPSMSSDLDQRSGGLATPRNDVSSGSEAQTGWTPEADASLGDPGTRPGDGPQARTVAEIVGLSKPEMELSMSSGRDQGGGGLATLLNDVNSASEAQADASLGDPGTPPVTSEAAAEMSPAARFAASKMKQLRGCIDNYSLLTVEKIRREVRSFQAAHREAQMPLKLYEMLASAFLSLSRLEDAMQVWADLHAAGHQPTVQTYSVMMRGFGYLGRMDAQDAMFRKMRQSGLQPDAYAWTTRIFSLFRRRQIEPGFQALREAGDLWIAAAQAAWARDHDPKTTRPAPLSKLLEKYPHDVDGVIRPNAVIMNSASSALARVFGHHQYIGRVLAWGRSFKIEPDVVTYNVLMNVSMREGSPEAACRILARMKERNMAPTPETWTILIAAFFNCGILDKLSAAEKQAKVIEFIDSAARAGGTAGLDVKGYALLIDRLLKVHQNPPAAEAVLRYMSTAGLQPNTHIYTILMDSYLAASPPDFAAADALWTRICAANHGRGAALDPQFYDRMIECYSTQARAAGGAQPALQFLRRMERAGMKPSWRALHALTYALADEKAWDRLRLIVRTALLDCFGDTGTVRRSTHGSRVFWSTVNDLGLLNEADQRNLALLLEEDKRRRVG